MNLHFPKLKVLAFRCGNVYCPLTIECPELKVLAYPGEPEEVHLLNIRNSDKIRKLITNMFGALKLAPFKNVECMVTEEFKVFSKETLSCLPRLNEIIYNQSITRLMYLFNLKVGSLIKIKRKLREFSNDVKLLGRPDFQFRFCGFQLNKINLDDIDFGLRVKKNRAEEVDSLYVYLQNYHLIDPGALGFFETIN